MDRRVISAPSVPGPTRRVPWTVRRGRSDRFGSFSVVPYDLGGMVPDPSTETARTRRSRRAVLATAATAGTALAGCSSLRRRRLSSSIEHGDGEMHVVYTAGGSAVTTASFLVSSPSDGGGRFRPYLSQELSGVRSYRLRFRPVVDGSVPQFTVALERPSGYPFPEYRFQSAEGHGWTLFEVPEMGAQSPGSFTVDFRFDLHETVDRLGVQVDMRATLDAGLDPRAYVAEALLTVHGPGAGEDG